MTLSRTSGGMKSDGASWQHCFGSQFQSQFRSICSGITMYTPQALSWIKPFESERLALLIDPLFYPRRSIPPPRYASAFGLSLFLVCAVRSSLPRSAKLDRNAWRTYGRHYLDGPRTLGQLKPMVEKRPARKRVDASSMDSGSVAIGHLRTGCIGRHRSHIPRNRVAFSKVVAFPHPRLVESRSDY